MNFKKQLKDGLITQNPALVQLIGMCPLLAIVLFASVRERMEFSKWPKAFDGFPIALVAASLISLAFMGFSGLKVW